MPTGRPFSGSAFSVRRSEMSTINHGTTIINLRTIIPRQNIAHSFVSCRVLLFAHNRTHSVPKTDAARSLGGAVYIFYRMGRAIINHINILYYYHACCARANQTPHTIIMIGFADPQRCNQTWTILMCNGHFIYAL